MNVQLHDMEYWHKKLGYVNYKLLYKLGNKGIIQGRPMFEKANKIMCKDCEIRKLKRAKRVQKGDITITHVLELMHIDLFRPTHTKIIRGKKYDLVCVDNYSRYTGISIMYILRNKLDTFGALRRICLNILTEKGQH